MVIVETEPFERVRKNYFDDDGFAALTYALYLRPKMGPVIPGTAVFASYPGMYRTSCCAKCER